MQPQPHMIVLDKHWPRRMCGTRCQWLDELRMQQRPSADITRRTRSLRSQTAWKFKKRRKMGSIITIVVIIIVVIIIVIIVIIIIIIIIQRPMTSEPKNIRYCVIFLIQSHKLVKCTGNQCFCPAEWAWSAYRARRSRMSQRDAALPTQMHARHACSVSLREETPFIVQEENSHGKITIRCSDWTK